MARGRWKAIAKEAWEKTLLVANFFCALHVTTTYLCTPVHLRGPSMVPTFNLTGDLVLVERLSPRFGKVGPGDVILYRSPVKPWQVVTKRLIGLEGDTVTYLVDGDQVETLVVPKGHIWAQGDNIYNSRDSRTYGPVPYGLLWGRAIWKERGLMAAPSVFLNLYLDVCLRHVDYCLKVFEEHHTAGLVTLFSIPVKPPGLNEREAKLVKYGLWEILVEWEKAPSSIVNLFGMNLGHIEQDSGWSSYQGVSVQMPI